MKKLLLLLLIFPLATIVYGAEEDSVKKWEGSFIKDCHKFAIEELTLGNKGELSAIASSRVTANTKTIYISKQRYLQDIPDTINGIRIVQIAVDSNLKMLGKTSKNNEAAVYYISSFELNSQLSSIWVMPIDVKCGLFGTKMEYGEDVCKMNFFFHYDPPKYYYKGTNVETLE